MYYDGRSVLHNPIEAAKWYRLAADQGHAVAQTNLALMYGEGIGVEANAAEMAKLLQKAAETGEPRAQAQLGRLYLDGEGVAQNATEALKWFRASAHAAPAHTRGRPLAPQPGRAAARRPASQHAVHVTRARCSPISRVGPGQ